MKQTLRTEQVLESINDNPGNEEVVDTLTFCSWRAVLLRLLLRLFLY